MSVLNVIRLCSSYERGSSHLLPSSCGAVRRSPTCKQYYFTMSFAFLNFSRPSFLSRPYMGLDRQRRRPPSRPQSKPKAPHQALQSTVPQTQQAASHPQVSKLSYDIVLDSVLKVYCTHCEPNYELPWAMTPQRHSTSSAFIIPGRRILTNAHSVEHHTAVRVKKRYSDVKYDAHVIAIGNECDIALLHVDDDEFWEEFEEYHKLGQLLHPGPLPELQDPVRVIGYPSPGNQIGITAGVCSRVEMLHYAHGQDELLAVQIDAAVGYLVCEKLVHDKSRTLVSDYVSCPYVYWSADQPWKQWWSSN